MFKRLLPLVAFLPVATSSQAVLSQSLPTSAPNSQNASTTSSSTAPKPLQGGIQKVELSLETLRDIELDLKSALRASSSLYDEVTIQPVRIITQPNVVGYGGTIVNIPVGTEPIGPPQPARKNRVDAAMRSMKTTIDILKKNADDFVSGEKQLNLPDDVLTKLQPQLQEWVKTVNIIASAEGELEQQTKGPPYSNQAIAELTASIQQNMKALDKIRLAIYKVIRKEGKRISAHQAGNQ